MKKISLCIIAITIFTGYINSQWFYQQVPPGASYYITVDFANSQIGSAGGVFVESEFSGRAAYTTNGGLNWIVSQVPDSTRVLVEIKFINAITGYCAGAYNTGTLESTVNLNGYDKKTLQRFNSLLPSEGGNNKGLFLKTTNSGQNWFTYGTLPSNVYYLLGLHFINSTTGFTLASYDPFGGVNDGVLKTTNSGLNWQILTMPENINSLSGIYFTDLNTGYVVGYDMVSDTNRGVILKTTNSGVSWNRQIFMEASEFSSVHFTNASTGLATRSSGNSLTGIAVGGVYKTTNAGANWNMVSTFTNVELQTVQFVPASGTALIFGTRYIGTDIKDFLAKTINFGSNWIENSLNDTGVILIGAKLFDMNNWYITGGDFYDPEKPVILHTTNGGAIGITQISNQVPDKFSLSQNYPNPFNPTTKISFGISNSGNVKLNIYDMLGREVSLLVNGDLTAGRYEVTFDASATPSGVYFYKIVTHDFTETKRMILLK